MNFPSGGLAVNDTHLYWTSYAGNPHEELYAFPSRIGRANLDGTGVEENFITGGGGAVAVDDSHVWWADSGRFGGAIGRTNLDGTGTESVIGGENFFPSGVAVDDTHVYWTGGVPARASGIGAIGRANLDGSGIDHCFIAGAGARGLGVAVDALGPQPSERSETPRCPANEFSFGRVKKSKRKGTARLTVKIPGDGELDLDKTRRVKADQRTAEAAGKEKLSVRARRKARKKLNRKGKAKVRAEITYTPSVGQPNTKAKRIKLIKRR